MIHRLDSLIASIKKKEKYLNLVIQTCHSLSSVRLSYEFDTIFQAGLCFFLLLQFLFRTLLHPSILYY